MKRSIALLLCILPGIAGAANDKWLLDGADSVEIAGTVELPMYRGEATHGNPTVAATVPLDDAAAEGEEAQVKTLLVYFRNGGFTEIGKGLLGELGLTDRKGYALIPQLNLGDVVLYDVRAKVNEASDHLVLSMSTIDELGYAFMNSKGVVQLVPAAEGAALVSGVGQPQPVTQPQQGKYWVHGVKKVENGVDMYVPGSIGDAQGLVLVSPYHALDQWLVLEHAGEVDRTAGGHRMARRGATIGDLDLGESWFQVHGGKSSAEATWLGTIGSDVTWSLDMAFDATSATAAFTKAGDPKWADPNDILVKAARDDFARAEADASTADDDTETAAAGEVGATVDEGDAEAVARNTALGEALWAAGSSRDALRRFETAAEAAGDNCAAYLRLGEAQLESGDPEGAIESLVRAGELYDKWWNQSLALRREIAADKAIGDDLWTLEQPGDCHRAWGLAAAAHLASGNGKAVAQIYEAHLDLDPYLPAIYGLTLAAGDLPAANGALRRAINLGAGQDEALRLALGYVNGANGQTAVFEAQVEALASGSLSLPLPTVLLSIEFARELNGDAAATKTAQSFVDANPLSVSAALGHALAQPQADRKGKDLVARATANVNRTGGTSQAYSELAVAHAIAGDTKAATGALKSAADAGELGPAYRVAKATVAQLAGEQDKAIEAYAQLASIYPGYILPKAWKPAE